MNISENTGKKFQTPMMLQYTQIKKEYPDCLLLFRLGDFYELFLEDAKIGADILDITLTSRSRGKDGRIPMAGVPYHAVDSYLNKLVKAGFKVAICEQLSDPMAGELVERGVVRIVTPGTVLDEKSLIKGENNYIISFSKKDNNLGFASCDISTGEFYVAQENFENLQDTLFNIFSKYNPKECVLEETHYSDSDFLKVIRKNKSINIFKHTTSNTNHVKHLKEHFSIQDLASFGLQKNEHEGAIAAASVLLDYLKYTQKGDISHINKIVNSHDENAVFIDRSTITNLELFSTIRDDNKKGTLIKLINKTTTSMGGRLLKQWVMTPLTKNKDIKKRHDTVGLFVKNRKVREVLQVQLKEVSDIERLIARLTVGLGTPRDLINLSNSLHKINEIKGVLKNLKKQTSFIKDVVKEISDDLEKVVENVEKTIVEEPPIESKQGGLIKDGVNLNIDKLRKIINGSNEWINNLEAREKKRTGISSLKIKYNKVFGFYIEISKSNLKLVPNDYIRKQTLVNGERFITPQLKEQEEIILSAKEKVHEIEHELFLEMTKIILTYTKDIQAAAQSIARLDCILGFSQLASFENYVKPRMTTDGIINIKNGRHPVVEKLLDDTQFVPNDVYLDSKTSQLHIITGPNMAGKSVYIRQVALIVLLAQMGSFVPADSAQISTVDKVFVRSGASDVITSGLSTFMVEMVETANILSNATNNSLIILDEIGRGTSTFDGISIAAATAEYLVDKDATVRPKTLFATHYHELESLEDKFPKRVKNFKLAIEDDRGSPVFLYKVVKGGAGHSFGLAVAKLAGLPDKLLKRAGEILHILENGKNY